MFCLSERVNILDWSCVSTCRLNWVSPLIAIKRRSWASPTASHLHLFVFFFFLPLGSTGSSRGARDCHGWTWCHSSAPPIQAHLFCLFFSFLSVVMVYSCPSQIKRASTPDPASVMNWFLRQGSRDVQIGVRLQIDRQGLIIMFLFC